MKIFHKIILIIRLFILKKCWNNYNKYTNKILKEEKRINTFKKIFIQDEEDKILNKKIFISSNNLINKYKYKKDKYKKSLDKIFFKLDILLDYKNFLFKCNYYKISSNKISFIRDIYKNYIKNK